MLGGTNFILGVAAGGLVAAGVWAVARWLGRREMTPEASSSPNSPIGPAGAAVQAPPGDVLPPRIEDNEVWVAPDQVRLSERIVIELARAGRMPPDEPVRGIRTQRGLAEALSSNQSAISKVLQRLAAANIVEEDRRHIIGEARRLKVYGLTRAGELLARELASQRKISLLPSSSEAGRMSTSNPATEDFAAGSA